MKNLLRIFLASAFCFLATEQMFAYKNPGTSGKNTPKAAGCAAAAAFTDMAVNNVRCRINTGGDMWWDLEGNARYFIPGSTTKTSMFSASLWIGGLDVNDQLKLAAQRYRGNGNDYWPGPLTTDGTAAIDPATCTKFDKLYRIKRSEVDQFIAWFTDPNANPDYSIPKSIQEWPAHGDVDKNQSYYLAPFFDNDGDGNYDPARGDYPYYDRTNALCPFNPENKFKPPKPTMEEEHSTKIHGSILADQVIKGDETLWWVFNDKGNIHSETQGSAIGLEIRAQCFGFATNDEINNMTFYSYEIINRSTYRLKETYFSQWVDTDLGYAWDDYVGCDVKRGLGYCYNGKAIDGSGQADAYGSQPPAVGVDFFQGPYMDDDNIDNPKYKADGTLMCDFSVNGVNFQDSIIDNERFGMRRFVYHNNIGGYWAMTDPDKAAEYYNFLRGIWKDGIKMRYGGNAHPNAGGTGPECDFMFPSDTDPCNWGTGGVQPAGYITGAGGSGIRWTEETAGNLPYDRRFMESAGPFTLEPGAVNYITVGIPWARATSGGPWASVQLLQTVDDKCQKLFDNCFKVVDGPDAPDLVAQELDKEVILYVSNRKISNNYKEKYAEYDPNIITPDSVDSTGHHWTAHIRYDSLYRFEGYQIFQLKNASVSIAELSDPDMARLVAECDLQNGIANVVNFEFDQDLGANVPVMKVQGNDRGIVHSFRILEDKFATGDKRLINHKQYYYIAIAYAYNNFKTYNQNDPLALDGQKKPYLAGRKSATGSIKAITVIPHITSPEAGGTTQNSSYGDGPVITRIEGQGNGGMFLDLSKETEDFILSKPPYDSISNSVHSASFNIDNYPIAQHPVYTNGHGPLNIFVADPLNVKKGNYQLKFDVTSGNVDAAKWTLTNMNDGSVYTSDTSINFNNEQLLLDLGLSVTITQSKFPGDTTSYQNGFIGSSIEFADSSKVWLIGVPDQDVPGPFNWIRAGVLTDQSNSNNNDWNMPTRAFDPNGDFEKVVGGLWSPYNLVAYKDQDATAPGFTKVSKLKNQMSALASVDVVFTSDKSKWTRCPVVEMCYDKYLSENGVDKFKPRGAQSVDKDGNPAPVGSGPSTNPDDPNYISETGMGWFPGYAINLETGERLNMMFGENSWLVAYHGRDMAWNPTPDFVSNFDFIFGGMHYVYVMAHTQGMETGYPEYDCPAYDAGRWALMTLSDDNTRMYAYASCMWVTLPIGVTGEDLLSNDLRVKLRVAKPYARNFSTFGTQSPQNDNYPLYQFSTDNIATITNAPETAKTALDLINVVPNPYYGYSGYEVNQLDNRIKITNLPEKCTVTIYNMSGTLIRQFSKDETRTSIDWDLKNTAGIPIAGGIYLIHVKVPGIGEKVIKWFGTLRPVDLNAF